MLYLATGEHQFLWLANPDDILCLCEHRVLGLAKSDVILYRMHQLFWYMTVSSCLAAMTKMMLTGP